MKYRIVDSIRITSAVIAISFLIGAGLFFILNETFSLGIYLKIKRQRSSQKE
jgi:hypothetical protein